jgi:ketosteroid isomerase-like protein
MKLSKSIQLVVSAAVALVLCAVTFHAYASESDVAEIKALETNLNTSASAKDADGIMKNYVPDETLVVFDVIPPRQYVGAESYKKNWQGFLGSFNGPVTFENSDMQVVADGKLGYAHYFMHITGTGEDGKPVDMTVRTTDVLRKVKGKWLIVHEHISVPVDVASGKPDMSSKP